MSKAINNPHDKIFKQALSELKVAKEFFKNYLPAKVLKKINLDSLILCKETYIDEKLREHMSDILYKVQLNNNKIGYFYLIAEHQSSKDRFIAFRVWKYAFLVIDRYLKEHKKCKKIPMVFPIIFCNGIPASYNGNADLFELFEDVEVAREFFLQPIKLINVTKLQDEEIKRHTLSGMLEFLQKYIFAKNFIPVIDNIIFVELLNNLQQYGLYELSKNMILYILTTSNINSFDELANQLNKIGVDAMSIADELISKGVTQGMQQGRQQGCSSLFMQLLIYKFKNIPNYYQQKIQEADTIALFKWSKRVISSDKLEEIFQD